VNQSNLRRMEIAEVIQDGDVCFDVNTGTYIPAQHSVGRKVRPENRGYVFTSRARA